MKQFLFIGLILLVAALGGWSILNLKLSTGGAAETKQAQGNKDEGHADGDEHGHKGHGKEGYVELTAEALKNANLKIEEAAPAKIKTTLSLYGKMAANEEAVVHVMPRYPGVVKAVNKRLGDSVQKGDVLAVVENNDSLRSYEIRSDLSGTITDKSVTLGEVVKGDIAIFVISDLSTVWVDLNVFRQDFLLLKKGQAVDVQVEDGAPPIRSTISYVSPFGAESTQTMLARTVIYNPNGDLRPGLFVTAKVQTAEKKVPVAVKLAALQTLNNRTILFVQEGRTFEAKEVKLGVKDNEQVEVISGILPGEQYVAGNSFILKAEIGKSEAEHEH